MARNPMDGYRDIFPWPYAWSRAIAPHITGAVAQIDFLYDDLDKWTYNNHWSHPDVPPIPPERCVDFYWSDDGAERQQLPLDVGDDLVRLLLFYAEDKLLRIIWNHRMWTPELGWRDYAGPQGDFVDHVHTEWKEDA